MPPWAANFTLFCLQTAICLLRFWQLPMITSGFPGGSEGKESACQGRRCEFDPWVRRVPWRRKWHPTPVFLPGKSHGQRSLAGYSPQACQELDTTQQLKNKDIIPRHTDSADASLCRGF